MSDNFLLAEHDLQVTFELFRVLQMMKLCTMKGI